MRHNITDICGNSEFQNEIVARIIQEWTPAKTDVVLQPARSQEIQNIFDAVRTHPKMLRLAARHRFIFQK